MGSGEVSGNLLESQTMAMAAKALMEELRYLDGTPVQVVIAPGAIGGAAEAALCEEYFADSVEAVKGRFLVNDLLSIRCWYFADQPKYSKPLMPYGILMSDFIVHQKDQLSYGRAKRDNLS